MSLVTHTMPSPAGQLRLVASDKGLVAVLWQDDRPGRVSLGPLAEHPGHPVLVEAERQLADYFAGRRRTFDLPLDARGTAFQQRVWQALARIPFGETRSYGDIARAIGHPLAVRAVGAANGRNPISIVVPCHRVIGSTGGLTGFAGGLAVKALLLRLEGWPVPDLAPDLFDRLTPAPPPGAARSPHGSHAPEPPRQPGHVSLQRR